MPVRYSSLLASTIFADDYNREKYSSYIDNINLLYVAMTRAKDALYGFVPGNAGKASTIAETIKNALASGENPAGSQGMALNQYFDSDKGVFEFGEIPGSIEKQKESEVIISELYTVNSRPESLRLRLHGENYFSPSRAATEAENQLWQSHA